MYKLNGSSFTDLEVNQLKKIDGGAIPVAPFILAGWLAYQTYNEIIDFKNDFIEGYNENRNKKI